MLTPPYAKTVWGPGVVTYLEVPVPFLLAGQECIQDGPHALFFVLVLATDDIAECAHPPEELLIYQAGAVPTRQVGQVKVDWGTKCGLQPTQPATS